MAINAVNPTVPVANDVILGEFKLYANYGLPTQLLIGATLEGCKIDIERTIKQLAFDGAYGHTLDVDGVPLVRYEKLIGRITVNNLYLKYFNRKVISDCESTGAWASNDWSSTGGVYAADTSVYNSGSQSAQATIAAASANFGIREVFTASKDLTVFDNGEASDSSDFIKFAINISTQELTDLGSADIRVSFHMDSLGTETNLYYYDVAASALTADQWNTFSVAKSGFTMVGTGDWSAVLGVSVKVDAATTAETVFNFDTLGLVQDQSDSSLLPVNGSGFDYTLVSDTPDYKEYTADLEIEDNDYLDNVTLIGQRMDGKKVKIILKQVLNDGAISLAMESASEVVNETQFTGHYTQSAGITCPIELYEYQ